MCISSRNLHIARTNIVIDNDLMAAALKARPNATKRSVVEEGLRLIVRLHRQRRVRSLRGKSNVSTNLSNQGGHGKNGENIGVILCQV
jgi:Arc/MetJ family transcription regulator